MTASDEPGSVSDDGDAIDPRDIVIDTFRSTGPGGVTYSAVRITHQPTGIVVTSENEYSQPENRDAAMRLLRSELS